jgi:hypothetical protein
MERAGDWYAFWARTDEPAHLSRNLGFIRREIQWRKGRRFIMLRKQRSSS